MQYDPISWWRQDATDELLWSRLYVFSNDVYPWASAGRYSSNALSNYLQVSAYEAPSNALTASTSNYVYGSLIPTVEWTSNAADAAMDQALVAFDTASDALATAEAASNSLSNYTLSTALASVDATAVAASNLAVSTSNSLADYALSNPVWTSLAGVEATAVAASNLAATTSNSLADYALSNPVWSSLAGVEATAAAASNEAFSGGGGGGGGAGGVVIALDMKAPTSDGGHNTSLSNYFTRDLNTLTADTGGCVVSLSNNVLTVGPGVYHANWWTTAHYGSISFARYKACLMANGTAAGYTQPLYKKQGSADEYANMLLPGDCVVSSPSNIGLTVQMWMGSLGATSNNLGVAVGGTSGSNVYTSLTLHRLGDYV